MRTVSIKVMDCTSGHKQWRHDANELPAGRRLLRVKAMLGQEQTLRFRTGIGYPGPTEGTWQRYKLTVGFALAFLYPGSEHDHNGLMIIDNDKAFELTQPVGALVGVIVPGGQFRWVYRPESFRALAKEGVIRDLSDYGDRVRHLYQTAPFHHGAVG